jgi:hypothetical protein
MRAMVFRPLRFYIRAQRASLARAVLVVRNADGSVLIQLDRTGKMGLPSFELDGWQPSMPQVEGWAEQVFGRNLRPALAAIEGHCGELELIYTTRPVTSAEINREARWLTSSSAAEHLPRAHLNYIETIM